MKARNARFGSYRAGTVAQLCVSAMDDLEGVPVRCFPNHALDGPHNLSLAEGKPDSAGDQ
jgi:hypothetical protein